MIAPLLSFIGLDGVKLAGAFSKAIIVVVTLCAIALVLWFGVRYIEKKDEAIRLLTANNTKLEEVVASKEAEITKARENMDVIQHELTATRQAKTDADRILNQLRRQLQSRNLTNERQTNPDGTLLDLNDTVNRMFDFRN